MTFTSPGRERLDDLVALMREFYASERIPFDESLARRALGELIVDPALGVSRIFEEDGRMAGYVILTFGFSVEFGGRLAWVDELYVREPYRRRGVARAVLRFAEQVCRERGLSALRLEVDRANLPAQTLYRRVGFEDPRRDILTMRIPTG